MDEEYYLLTLMAIARELNVFSIREADVHLAAGLPLLGNQKQANSLVANHLSYMKIWLMPSSPDNVLC